MEKPTTADLKADALRSFRWKFFLPNVAWMFMLFRARAALSNPAVVGHARIYWLLAPLPLLVWAYWAWWAGDKLQDELQRNINGRAAMTAMRFTIFWLFALVLVDAAFGIPFRIPAPFGLPDDSFGWLEAAMVPLFVLVGAGVWETRKVLPRR